MLREKYGVESEVQMPATDAWPSQLKEYSARADGIFRILYIGNGVSARDSLELMVEMVREKTLRKYGMEKVELHLCAPLQIDDPAVRNHGWVSESEARRQVAEADVVFLPYGFSAEDRPVATTSFPAKSADYFASGKPVLVLGPGDCTTVQHAEKYQCAAVVTKLDKDAVAQAISRLATDADYRGRLKANAARAFEENHNILRQQERLAEVVTNLAGCGRDSA
jgi:glycosyltransferase involved in cell wall biosynthesis